MAVLAMNGWCQKSVMLTGRVKKPIKSGSRTSVVIFDATIPILPLAKKRPRVTSIGGQPRMYQSDKGSQRELAHFIKLHRKATVDIGVPVELEIVVVLKKPKGTKYKAAPCARPDIDNYLKMLMDALVESQTIPDDAQITGVSIKKRWPIEDLWDEPGWYIKATAQFE